MLKPSILITGGAGYVGSHIARLLAYQGYTPIIIDSYIHNQSFSPSWAVVYQADYADQKVLSTLFSEHSIEAVVHAAALIEVGASVSNPASFYEVNVVKTIQLLNTMLEYGVKKIIFSSSAAVYGNAGEDPISENHPCQPINPYGRTKYIIEQVLQDFETAYGLQYVILRYFNVAGAWPEEGLGEFHQPETHLIPLVLQALLNNKPFTIFGNTYSTPDGTAIRDYIHVRDIAEAHLKSLVHLDLQRPSDIFNIGSGRGVSIKEIVNISQDVTQKLLTLHQGVSRKGDPAILIADCSKAEGLLQWFPQYSTLPFVIGSVYNLMISEKRETDSNNRQRKSLPIVKLI